MKKIDTAVENQQNKALNALNNVRKGLTYGELLKRWAIKLLCFLIVPIVISPVVALVDYVRKKTLGKEYKRIIEEQLSIIEKSLDDNPSATKLCTDFIQKMQKGYVWSVKFDKEHVLRKVSFKVYSDCVIFFKGQYFEVRLNFSDYNIKDLPNDLYLIALCRKLHQMLTPFLEEYTKSFNNCKTACYLDTVADFPYQDTAEFSTIELLYDNTEYLARSDW